MHMFFFFNDTATTEIYTLSLHDALPILVVAGLGGFGLARIRGRDRGNERALHPLAAGARLLGCRADEWRRRCAGLRSEEHTSELQSRQYLVCRLLLEKKKQYNLHLIDRY